MKNQKRTWKDRLEFVEKVDELRATGKRTNDACREAACTSAQYYAWNKRLLLQKKKKPTPPLVKKSPQFVTIESPARNDTMILDTIENQALMIVRLLALLKDQHIR